MKALRTWFLLSLAAVLLTACQFRAVHEEKPANAQEAVVQAIDELNVAIAAGSSTLLQAWKDGAVSQSEFTDSRDMLNKAAGYRDEAQALLKAGDVSTAQGRLNVAASVLSVVQKRLIAIKGKS